MSRQKPNMRNIAEVANVSLSTVSLVLNNRPGISSETRERVLAVAAELGYEPSTGGANGAGVAIGLLIEQSSMSVLVDIFYGEIIRGFQTEAQRLGYHVLLHMFDRSSESLDVLHQRFTNKVQGLVVANDGDITPEMVVQFEEADLPLVLVENYVPGHQLPCVLGDNFTAGYIVMHHLLKLGHRRIAVLQGPVKYSSLVDRLRGVLAAAAEAGLLIPPAYMPQPHSGHPQKGYLQMKEILALADRPTAVVAISDKTAFGAMEAIREAQLRIPQDIAVASIDDVAESAYTRPPLTSFHIPRRNMGILAMQKLHRIIKGEPEVAVKSIVYGDLVVRESCGGQRLATAEPGVS